MNIVIFQQQAIALARFPITRSLDYYILALVGEIAELLEVELAPAASDTENKRLLELGDVLFYCAALAQRLGYTLQPNTPTLVQAQIAPGQSPVTYMAMHAGLLANMAKKLVRDGKQIDVWKASAIIEVILSLADDFARQHVPGGLEEAMSSQIAKLENARAQTR